MQTNPSEIPPRPPTAPLKPVRINWIIFFLALFAPALFAVLGAKIKSDGLVMGSTLFGSLVAGLVCGVWMGLGFGRTPVWRLALGVVFTFVFGVVSLVLACFGCSLGGFNLNIH